MYKLEPKLTFRISELGANEASHRAGSLPLTPL
jgi:hypothetical protein